MSDITDDTIKHVAKLSRFTLTDEEVKRFRSELASILNYVEQLNEIDTEGVEPTAQVSGRVNVMREDKVQDYGTSRDDLLKNVPQTQDGYIKVRRVL